MPTADCWCFGSPCTSFSLAGLKEGLDGESGLIKEVFRILRETRESNRPEWIIYENVKGMFSSTKGLDFLTILTEMDACGYDIGWQLFNTADYIPQWRERVYTVGHLRSRGVRQVLPIEGSDVKAGVQTIKQIGQRNRPGRNNLNQYRVYDPSGIAPTLNKMEGGGRQPHITVDLYNKDIGGTCRTLKYQYQKNNSCNFTRGGERGASAVQVDIPIEKTDDGAYIQWLDGNMVYARWNDAKGCYSAVRKITPLEAFRLQGFPDEYFYKAEFVNSNCQLYRQAGNAISVPVMYEIARRLSD